MVRAYVMIETMVGRARHVARDAAAIDGVTDVHRVTGPYDLIVRAVAADAADLERRVVDGIRSLPGVTRILACAANGPGVVTVPDEPALLASAG